MHSVKARQRAEKSVELYECVFTTATDIVRLCNVDPAKKKNEAKDDVEEVNGLVDVYRLLIL